MSGEAFVPLGEVRYRSERRFEMPYLEPEALTGEAALAKGLELISQAPLDEVDQLACEKYFIDLLTACHLNAPLLYVNYEANGAVRIDLAGLVSARPNCLVSPPLRSEAWSININTYRENGLEEFVPLSMNYPISDLCRDVPQGRPRLVAGEALRCLLRQQAEAMLADPMRDPLAANRFVIMLEKLRVGHISPAYLGVSAEERNVLGDKVIQALMDTVRTSAAVRNPEEYYGVIEYVRGDTTASDRRRLYQTLCDRLVSLFPLDPADYHSYSKLKLILQVAPKLQSGRLPSDIALRDKTHQAEVMADLAERIANKYAEHGHRFDPVLTRDEIPQRRWAKDHKPHIFELDHNHVSDLTLREQVWEDVLYWCAQAENGNGHASLNLNGTRPEVATYYLYRFLTRFARPEQMVPTLRALQFVRNLSAEEFRHEIIGNLAGHQQFTNSAMSARLLRTLLVAQGLAVYWANGVARMSTAMEIVSEIFRVRLTSEVNRDIERAMNPVEDEKRRPVQRFSRRENIQVSELLTDVHRWQTGESRVAW